VYLTWAEIATPWEERPGIAMTITLAFAKPSCEWHELPNKYLSFPSQERSIRIMEIFKTQVGDWGSLINLFLRYFYFTAKNSDSK
jgi:hypothetical protein